MRFTISREKLQEGLAAVAASIPAKTTLPVLANILVETTDAGIRLSGTDLDIAVSTEVAADVETPGAITIPAKKLSEIARELPPSPVKMAAAGEQRVTLDCGRSHFKLLGPAARRVPQLSRRCASTRAGASRVGRPAEAHPAHVVRREHRGEPPDPQRRALGAAAASRMRMVATNGHRLAKMELPIKSSGAAVGRPDRAAEGARPDPPPLPGRRGARDRARRQPPRLPLAVHRGVHAPDRGAVSELRAGHPEGQRPHRDRRQERAHAARSSACRSSPPTRRTASACRSTRACCKFSVQTPDLGEATDELPIRYTATSSTSASTPATCSRSCATCRRRRCG